jgi:hypothetical protein
MCKDISTVYWSIISHLRLWRRGGNREDKAQALVDAACQRPAVLVNQAMFCMLSEVLEQVAVRRGQRDSR